MTILNMFVTGKSYGGKITYETFQEVPFPNLLSICMKTVWQLVGFQEVAQVCLHSSSVD